MRRWTPAKAEEARKIRHLAAQGVVQKDLASQFGLSISAISLILKGRRRPEQSRSRAAERVPDRTV